MNLGNNFFTACKKYFFHTPSRTVRYAFPVLLVSGIMLVGNTISSQQQPEVILEVSDTQIVIGETAYVDVRVKTQRAINAATIIITAPTSKVLIDTIEVSDSVITLWTEEPKVEDGSVILRGGTFRRGFVGEHTIARIAFTPSTSGSFAFSATDIELVAGDGEGTVIKPDAERVKSETVYAFKDNENKLAATDTARYERAIREQLAVGDSMIGLREISRFMSAWSTKESTYDFDGDSRMTFRDFAILLAYSFGL